MFGNLEKMPVKEFNVGIKVSRVRPATILKKCPLSFLIFQAFDHDYRRTILGNTFRCLICTGKGFGNKTQVKC